MLIPECYFSPEHASGINLASAEPEGTMRDPANPLSLLQRQGAPNRWPGRAPQNVQGRTFNHT